MRSEAANILPPPLHRSLAKLGGDIRNARRRRRLTVVMMAERVGVSKPTYQRVEKGDPRVSMGVYAMSLFALGFADSLGMLADVQRDSTGLRWHAPERELRVSRAMARHSRPFALEPGLPLVPGPQFRRVPREGSVFHAAIADTEPDGWGRRVILRDHAKRRQKQRRSGTAVAQRALDDLDYSSGGRRFQQNRRATISR